MDFTKNQKEAIEYFDSPLLIVAGPGAGKTGVLINKVDYLINKKNISPSNIIITTFTIKAAEELRKRITRLNPNKDVSPMFIGTIHSFCENIIKIYGGTREEPVEFEILDDVNNYLFIRKNFNKIGLNRKELTDFYQVPFGTIIENLIIFYNTLTENLIDINEFKKDITNISNEELIIRNKIVDSYVNYINLLKKLKLMDFSLLLRNAFELLKDEKILNSITKNINYVLIDEFQDINPLQWKIFYNLTKDSKKITVVGDVNQSIYGFRGSNPNIFEKFKEEFKDVKIIELNDNFRSRIGIINVSNNFLSNRKKIEIKPVRKENCNLFLNESKDEKSEAFAILSMIKNLHDNKGYGYGNFAILFKSVKYYGKEFINLLRTTFDDIPYSVYGGNDFLRNEEIIDIINLLVYVYGINSDEIKSDLIIKNNNFFDLFSSELLLISKESLSLIKSKKELEYDKIINEKVLINQGFCEKDAEKIVKINKIKTNIDDKKILTVFYELLGVIDRLEGDNKLKDKIIFNLASFSKLISNYSKYYEKNNLKKFLNIVMREFPENLKLGEETEELIQEQDNSLKLMTVHQAKGLEFPVVIMPSIIQNRFPRLSKRETFFEIPEKFFLYEPYDSFKEEENLFYVGITRAQDELILSKFLYHSKKSTSESEFLKRIRNDFKPFKPENVEISSKNEIKEGFMIMDYSGINNYMYCSEKFKFRNVFGFVYESSTSQNIGKIYHNSLAKINARLMQKSRIDNEELKKIVEESWIPINKKNEQSLKFKIFKDLKRYHEIMKNEIKEPQLIEKSVGFNLENARLKGRIDFLYKNKKNEIVLLDFKSRKLKNIEETGVNTQLKAYSEALDREGIRVDKAIAYPIQEEKFKLNDSLVDISGKEKLNVKVLIKDIINNVKEKKWVNMPKKKEYCKTCPYGTICKKKRS